MIDFKTYLKFNAKTFKTLALPTVAQAWFGIQLLE